MAHSLFPSFPPSNFSLYFSVSLFFLLIESTPIKLPDPYPASPHRRWFNQIDTIRFPNRALSPALFSLSFLLPPSISRLSPHSHSAFIYLFSPLGLWDRRAVDALCTLHVIQCVYKYDVIYIWRSADSIPQEGPKFNFSPFGKIRKRDLILINSILVFIQSCTIFEL